MNWLRKIMYGRYGVDQLTMGLMILSLVLSFLLPVFGLFWIDFILYIPMVLALMRVFSKNYAKRRQENEKFLKLWNPIANWFKVKFSMLKQSKTHKFFKCPSCNTTVRVPKGKGKISITCPKCHVAFIKRS